MSINLKNLISVLDAKWIGPDTDIFIDHISIDSRSLQNGSKTLFFALSGANNDGTNGLLAVKQNGGTVIIQKPETADVPYMPAHAIKNLEADYILSPTEIAEFIKGLAE